MVAHRGIGTTAWLALLLAAPWAPAGAGDDALARVTVGDIAEHIEHIAKLAGGNVLRAMEQAERVARELQRVTPAANSISRAGT